jgi:hypothetical protein
LLRKIFALCRVARQKEPHPKKAKSRAGLRQKMGKTRNPGEGEPKPSTVEGFFLDLKKAIPYNECGLRYRVPERFSFPGQRAYLAGKEDRLRA